MKKRRQKKMVNHKSRQQFWTFNRWQPEDSKNANTDTNRTTVTHGRPKAKNKGHNNCGPKHT